MEACVDIDGRTLHRRDLYRSLTHGTALGKPGRLCWNLEAPLQTTRPSSGNVNLSCESSTVRWRSCMVGISDADCQGMLPSYAVLAWCMSLVVRPARAAAGVIIRAAINPRSVQPICSL